MTNEHALLPRIGVACGRVQAAAERIKNWPTNLKPDIKRDQVAQLENAVKMLEAKLDTGSYFAE